ncbi:MAG: aspartate/glutamate racemase family protein [Proteobacteria bacterium]|nr:aspartate/glutamate racemase family protein [Pseudomonadota bacterium]
MRLLLINPNTSASITDLVARRAREVAPSGVSFDVATARFGARYIGSRVSAAIAAHAALDAFASAYRPAHAGVLLACFGDPGLDALAEVSPVPVVGMAAASMRVAVARARRVGMLTGGERWVPMLKEFVAGLGLADRLVCVRAVAATGAQIAADPEPAFAELAAQANAAAREDGAEIVILGGAGLTGLVPALQPRVGVPLLDSLECTVTHLVDLARRPGNRPTPPPGVETVGLGGDLAKLMGKPE